MEVVRSKLWAPGLVDYVSSSQNVIRSTIMNLDYPVSIDPTFLVIKQFSSHY